VGVAMRRVIVSVLLSIWTYRAVRLALGLVFVVSGALKLAAPAEFAHIIREYQLLPGVLAPPVALGLPALEVAAGLGLLADARGSLAAIAGMLALFMVVLWYGVLADLHIDCGCFGPEDLAQQDSLHAAFIRDAWMAGGVVYLYLARRLRPGRGPRRLPALFANLSPKGEIS